MEPRHQYGSTWVLNTMVASGVETPTPNSWKPITVMVMHMRHPDARRISAPVISSSHTLHLMRLMACPAVAVLPLLDH